MARVSTLSLAGVPLLAGSAVPIVVPLTRFVGAVLAIGSSVVGPELLVIAVAEGKFGSQDSSLQALEPVCSKS